MEEGVKLKEKVSVEGRQVVETSRKASHALTLYFWLEKSEVTKDLTSNTTLHWSVYGSHPVSMNWLQHVNDLINN